MNNRSSLSALRWVALIFIFCAVVLTTLQLIRFSRIRGTYPPGMTIASVPVGGLDRQGAAQVLLQTYAVPIEVRYNESIIHIKPGSLGFDLDLETMLSAADLQRSNQPFWVSFWNHLWNQVPTPTEIPLVSKLSTERLRIFLNDEIAVRYDQPPTAAVPVGGTVNFQPGHPGSVLDIDRSVAAIETALKSPSARVVNLTINKTSPPRPSYQNLKILLQQIISQSGYTGLAEVYVLDLKNREEVHFANNQGEEIEPNITFTAASVMKIPVMISVFRRLEEPTPAEVINLMEEMIRKSDNYATDQIAQTTIDKNLAPLMVTEDLNTLGLENTYWAGYFYPGAPLLRTINTPANGRTDVFTDPDRYNQATPYEIGTLLDDIYQCAEKGGGTLLAAFAGEITPSECQKMISLLEGNHLMALLQAGLPEGTRFAHKHGYVLDPVDGMLHNIGDVGIVYSPGGDYVVSLFLYSPTQIVFDSANQIAANLSLAIYNFFNQYSQ
jgi:beta-lactamase class A